MKLLHCFPRPLKKEPVEGSQKRPVKSEVDHIRSQMILHCILNFGILCTPERLKINIHNQPPREHIQSRFCLTLATERELFEDKIINTKGLMNSKSFSDLEPKSHADLFGPYAIAFDPQVSRRLGFAPTTYYSPTNILGTRFSQPESTAPGLGLQIIHRLSELRELTHISHQRICTGRPELI